MYISWLYHYILPFIYKVRIVSHYIVSFLLFLSFSILKFEVFILLEFINLMHLKKIIYLFIIMKNMDF